MPKDQSKLKVTNNIRCTTLLPPFFFRNSKLYCKKLVIHLWFKVLSITGHYFLPSFGSVRIPRRKNWSSFEAIHESNFLLLHKTGSAGQHRPCAMIETSDSQREQRLENTAGEAGLPISTFPSMSWPLSQHEVEHCHAAKSHYRVSRCIAAVCLSMLGSNASITFDTDRLWLFSRF